MRSQVDSYSMLICSKYVKGIKDMINITLVNSKFRETIDKFHFNPFQINIKSRKYFNNLQTQWLFDEDDVIFSDGDISGHYVYYEVPYGKYLEMNDKYQNINFRRIIYTKNDRTKYGDEIPFVVKKLGNGCFYELEIEEINIPDPIVEIGISCFDGCKSLTSITISSKLTNIGGYAFYNCNQLPSITLPSVLTSLNSGLFYCCRELTRIEYSPFVVDLDELFYENGFSTITISTSITRIGNECFNNCKLTSLTIPSNVIYFGSYAFRYNYELKEVELPNNVMQLSDGMFYNCYKLAKINIPSSVTKIGGHCFTGCDILTIPTTLISQLHYIGSYCFNNEGINEITLNKQITYIGDNAFSNNPIKSVIIPSSLNCLNSSFSHCSELTHIEIPDSVTCLGDYTFYECINLRTIILPNSIANLGKYSFFKCPSLEYIVLPKMTKRIPDCCFSHCNSLTRIELPSSLTKIGDYCFDECIKLKEINIPMSAVEIGNYAFKECSELQSITGNIDVCIKYKDSFKFTPFLNKHSQTHQRNNLI